VYRGAYGTAASVPIHDLVVGDVLQISQGDRVPADCIILDEINLVVDQSAYSRKPSDRAVKKGESSVIYGEGGHVTDDNHKANPDNILYSDSKVMKGEARAIVCAVGDHTLLSRHRKKE
jgi:Ca2+-transporting ATPase